MKRLQLISAGFTAALAAVLVIGSATSSAQQGAEARAQQRRNSGADTNTDPRTRGTNIRVSQLLGVNIKNDADEGVGEVNDIVLNTRTGRISYAAVTYGGFLGLGDKMFAVPWEAFRWKQSADDENKETLVLNVTQKQLEGAEGFDQDHWPNFADRNWRNELDKRYGVDRERMRNRFRQNRGGRGVDVEVNEDGSTDVEVDRDN